METRSARLFVALLFAAAAVLTVGVWRRHGRHELARLAQAARSDLRDALKADKEVVRRTVYETWPYGWGYPHYGWWEERRTTFFAPAPAPQPSPEPRRETSAPVAPAVSVQGPGPESPPPPFLQGPPAKETLRRARRAVP